jgi:sec-independent protein translocase protein TatA
MPEIGVPELLIIAFVVLLLFGPGKAADLGSSLGKGIREFRRESASDGADTVSAATVSTAPAPASTRFCTECGTACTADQRFCSECGTSISSMT